MRPDVDLESVQGSGLPLLELPLVDTLTLASTSTADTEEAARAALWQAWFIQQWEVRRR